MATGSDDRFVEFSQPFECYYGDRPRYLILTGNLYENRGTIETRPVDFMLEVTKEGRHKRNERISLQINASEDLLPNGQFADASHVQEIPMGQLSPKVQKYLKNGALPGERSTAIYAVIRALHQGQYSKRELFATILQFPDFKEMVKEKAESRDPDTFFWEELTRCLAVSGIQPRAEGTPIDRAMLDLRGRRILEELKYAVAGAADVSPDKVPISLEFLRRLFGSFFWSNKSHKLGQIKDGGVFEHPERDATMIIYRAIGYPIDRERYGERGVMTEPQPDVEREMAKAVNRVVLSNLKDDQTLTVEQQTDPFTEVNEIRSYERAGEKLIVFPYGKISKLDNPQEIEFTNEYVRDFKTHFPQLDDFLQFLMAARFARNRKNAYLWLHCPSDWGKTFLLNTLRSSGKRLISETSLKEVEAMFEGKPVGQSPQDFLFSLALVVDEFKSVKSEFKQLDDRVYLAPKYLMKTSVPVYAKVFTSAEEVASLAGEHGVEDQFANRLSYIRGRGALNDRELFDQSSSLYFDGCQKYVLSTLQKLLTEYRKKGPVKAPLEAEEYLKDFRAKYSIRNTYASHRDSFGGLAREIYEWIVENYQTAKKHQYQERRLDPVAKLIFDRLEFNSQVGKVYLRTPGHVVEAYIDREISRSEQVTLKRNKDLLIRGLITAATGEPIPEDWDSRRLHRTDSGRKKALPLEDAWDDFKEE